MSPSFRRASEADFGLYAGWFADPELSRRLSPPTPEWRAFVATGAQSVWAATDETGQLLAIFQSEIDDSGADWLAIAIDPARRGTGLMAAILDAYIAGPGAGHQRFIGEIEPDNLASIALLRRCGFVETSGAIEGFRRFERPGPAAKG